MAGGCCRVGDVGMGICTHSSHAPTLPFPYVVTFSMGNPTVITNGLPTVPLGAIGLSTCGHPTTALLASTSVLLSGLGVHRLGDTGANFGPYVTTIASLDVIANTQDGA